MGIWIRYEKPQIQNFGGSGDRREPTPGNFKVHYRMLEDKCKRGKIIDWVGRWIGHDKS